MTSCVISLLAICLACGCATRGFHPMPVTNYFRDNILFSEPKSAEEVKTAGMVLARKSNRDDLPALPFGFSNDCWQQMKRKIKPGDKLVFFRSPEEDWEQLRGMEGYALVRGRMLIDVLITKIN